MRYTEQVFERETIDLDGNGYRDCKFFSCQLIFAGTAGVELEDCLFKDCNWSFQGYAAVTLGFLGALSKGARPGSDVGFLDSLLNSIKTGRLNTRSVGAAEPVAR